MQNLLKIPDIPFSVINNLIYIYFCFIDNKVKFLRYANWCEMCKIISK